MRCVVLGATGYLGMRLVPQLLAAGHDVRVVARTPAKLDDVPWRGDVEVVEGDVTDDEKVRQALTDQQVLYYLVHSMLAADFVDVDARGASIVADAAAQAGVARIIYVGGIIAENIAMKFSARGNLVITRGLVRYTGRNVRKST